jgi:hypothetical protein
VKYYSKKSGALRVVNSYCKQDESIDNSINLQVYIQGVSKVLAQILEVSYTKTKKLFISIYHFVFEVQTPLLSEINFSFSIFILGDTYKS